MRIGENGTFPPPPPAVRPREKERRKRHAFNMHVKMPLLSFPPSSSAAVPFHFQADAEVISGLFERAREDCLQCSLIVREGVPREKECSHMRYSTFPSIFASSTNNIEVCGPPISTHSRINFYGLFSPSLFPRSGN